MELSKNIANLRKKMGITQEKLAELCNVSRQAVTKWEASESEPTIEKLEILSNIFQVSIDEIIKGECCISSSTNKILTNDKELEKYLLYEECISKFNRLYDVEAFRENYYSILIDLYEAVKDKYISDDGEILEKYLVTNTSSQERGVIDVFLAGSFKESFIPFKEYVNGNIEIIQAIDEVIEELKNKEKIEKEKFESIRNTKLGKLFITIDLELTAESDLDDYSDKRIKEKSTRLLESIKEIKVSSVAAKILIMYAMELSCAIENRDNEAVKKLEEGWLIIQTSLWKLI